jgi:hypothetical protein
MPRIQVQPVFKADRLFHEVIKPMVDERPDFFDTRGPGRGDHYSNEFVAEMRDRAKDLFGEDYSEAAVHLDSNMRFDFLFPDEGTAVEIAMSLYAPQNEFERDIFKCLIHNEEHPTRKVRRLVFITKPPGGSVIARPAARAIAEYVRDKNDLTVDVLELPNKLDGVQEFFRTEYPAMRRDVVGRAERNDGGEFARGFPDGTADKPAPFRHLLASECLVGCVSQEFFPDRHGDFMRRLGLFHYDRGDCGRCCRSFMGMTSGQGDTLAAGETAVLAMRVYLKKLWRWLQRHPGIGFTRQEFAHALSRYARNYGRLMEADELVGYLIQLDGRPSDGDQVG